jgi:hypothetical protein
MSSTPWVPTHLLDGHSTQSQFLKDHRDRLAFEADERARQRRDQLSEQSSNLNAPEVRVSIWEKVHALRLPSNSTHAIIDVIAAGTGLTPEEVRSVQLARRKA